MHAIVINPNRKRVRMIEMTVTYLQDFLMVKMDAPFLPIIRPIFPGGMFNTDKISSSRAFPSIVTSPNKLNSRQSLRMR